MQFLVLIHVLSAIIGIGPTFFGHVLVRPNQTPAEYRNSSVIAKKLESFPKIGGGLAVLSGLALYFLGSYGSFTQLWLLGALVLFILIQVTVVGILGPTSAKINGWLASAEAQAAESFPATQKALVNKVNALLWVASAMGASIFILMILGSRGYIRL